MMIEDEGSKGHKRREGGGDGEGVEERGGKDFNHSEE